MNSSESEYRHIPVLTDKTIQLLNIEPKGIYVDGTLGGGGHASIICSGLSDEGTFIGIDRDKDAIQEAEKRLENYRCRKIFCHSNYSRIKEVLELNSVNGIDGGLLDLGVSSYQLDNEERGFSYMKDAPLDMRMNANDTLTAERIVNTYTEAQLTEIIRKYGEERWAKRISSFIIKARKQDQVKSTGQLVDIIKAAIPAGARKDGPHPAKRTFQAIRIEVNDELGPLRNTIEDFIDVLNPRGRLAVISFHSLEDRIVKETYKERKDPCTCPKDLPQCICGKVGDVKIISKKPYIADTEELEINPRSRSAKLRVIEKL